jgi:NADH:ubiquinone oxidoreductase subunit
MKCFRMKLSGLFSKNSIQTRLLTWVSGEWIGEDSLGNRYFQEKLLFGKFNRPLRRWVLYKGIPDASKIPSEWFGWIHFTHERPLVNRTKHSWEKPHEENMTGTPYAYSPTDQFSNQGVAKTVTKRYEPWQPYV